MRDQTVIRLGVITAVILFLLCGCGRKENQNSGQEQQKQSGEAEGISVEDMAWSEEEPTGENQDTGKREVPGESAYPVWAEKENYEVEPFNATEISGFTQEYGCSLIAGNGGIIRDQTGKEISPYAGDVYQLTDSTDSLQHIDIIGKYGVTITYDLGEKQTLDMAVICNFYHPSVNYSVGRYQLFLGNDMETLYREENCIADYDNTGKWNANVERSGADQRFLFPDSPEGTFFGIRFVMSNPTDDLVRIARICLYNEEYSAKRSVFSVLGDSHARVEEGYLADGEGKNLILEEELFRNLGNGVTDEEGLRFENSAEGLELIVPLEKGLSYDRVTVAGRMPEGAWYELSLWNRGLGNVIGDSRQGTVELGKTRFEKTLIEAEEMDTILLTELGQAWEGEELHMKMYGQGIWSVDEIGVYSDDRRVRISMQEILNDDFLGYGLNIIPTALMKESLQNGYKEGLFDLERRRIMTVRPGLSRLWFQIDWMENEKGVYDFDSERMQAVYPYLDVLKEAGGLVELNFGWKVGNQVKDWFAAEGAEGDAPAPADIESYAKSCAALLQELIINRGYDNICAVSAYNEPNFSAEFEYPETGKKKYYLEMMEAIKNAIGENGLDEQVQVWGPEESGSFQWYEYMAQKGKDIFDGYSFHVYGATCDGLQKLVQERRKVSGEKPMLLTEFGFMESETGWNGGNAAFALTAANSGLSGALFWSMTGVTLADPGTFMINDKDRHLWGPVQNGVDYVYRNYYEYGMMMACVDPHSSVLAVDSTGEDIRAAAFLSPEGDVTIVVQADEGEAGRRLKLSFDQKMNLSFHKFVYRQGQTKDANGLFPSCEEDIPVTDSLEDEIGGAYSLIVYTTKEPEKQIAFEEVKVEIEAGSSIVLNAEVIGTCAQPVTGKEKIVWSIQSGSGSIDQNGCYQSETGQRRYTTISVKAALESDPSVYGIVLIVLV